MPRLALSSLLPALLALVVALLIMVGLPHCAQASSTEARRDIAIAAAQNAGCVPTTYAGKLTTKEETVSSCFAGGFVHRNYVLPVCESNCDAVRLRPFASVTFECSSSQPPTVACV